MDRKTLAELGSMSPKDLILHHAEGDAEIAGIRQYQGTVHQITTEKQKAAKVHGPAELSQAIKGVGSKSIIEQVKDLPQNLIDELKAYFGGKN